MLCCPMPCHAVLCHAMLSHAMPFHSVPCCPMPCCAASCHPMLSYAMPCCPMLSHATPFHSVLCCPMLCCAVPCHPMPCHAVPHHAMPSPTAVPLGQVGQQQSVLQLSPCCGYRRLPCVFLITCNMRRLPWGARGLLSNITSHSLAFEGLHPRGTAGSAERDANGRAGAGQHLRHHGPSQGEPGSKGCGILISFSKLMNWQPNKQTRDHHSWSPGSELPARGISVSQGGDVGTPLGNEA